MSKKSSKNPGMSSSFKASNIQTYAAGGEMETTSEGPGNPFAVKRAMENSSFYLSPFYTNSRGSAVVPSYMLGFGTGMANPRKGGWSLNAKIGQEYPAAHPIFAGKILDFNNALNNEMQNSSLVDYIVPNPGDKNLSFAFDAAYRGKQGLDGQPFTPLVNLGFNKSKTGGLGAYVTGGAQFNFGKNVGRNGELKPGYIAGSIGPYGGFDLGPQEALFNYGLEGSADWKPKVFRDTPLSVYGKGHLGSSTNTGLSYGAEVGLRAPMKQIKQIDLPQLPSMASLINLTRNNDEDNTAEEGVQIPSEVGTGWGEAGKVNASPIHKMWQPEANDIYLQSGPIQNTEPMIYDPTMGTFQNTDEMNNYSKGGGIHINPANKGKFTASANAADMGVQEFAAHVLANKGSYTPLQIQRANFARNAASWQHAQGGFNNKGFQSLPPAVQAKIKANSFADGGQLTEFNEGGTHEESPIGGIPQGTAPDGKLNLVEQGETKLNAADYIFSDQIKINKETALLFDLPKGDVGKTFADVSKKLNRPNSRRDNDTIEQVAIQRDLENLMQAQEKQKEMQKDKDVAEFAAKYPDLAQNISTGEQQPQMAPAQMQEPQMDPNAMQQGMMQEQMAPPAGMPQEQIDPAMMAQMGQLPMSYGGALFNCGGKMYNHGGHMYSIGGNVMRGIGSTAYGIGEGLLDSLTFGLTDNLTDKGFNKLSSIGHRAQSEIEKDAMFRGFGNVGGAVLSAGLTGGATTSAAIGEAAEGLGSGISNIKGTNDKVDKITNSIGQGISTISGLMGPQGPVETQGILKGNEAVNKLMNASQNPFINQATQFGSNVINHADGGYIDYSMYSPLDHVTQYGGPLDIPTNNHPYINYLDPGGELNKGPILGININGIVRNYTLEQAQNDPQVLAAFGAEVDSNGVMIPESVEAAKLELEDRFSQETLDNRIAANQQNTFLPSVDTELNQQNQLEKLPNETDEQYAQRMHVYNMELNQKDQLGEIKQSPIQATMLALPAMYNLGRGIFEKPRVLDYQKYKQKANLEPYTMNIDPQIAQVRKSYAGARQAVKNAAPGGGAYLSNLQNLAAGEQEAMNELLAKKEMFDKEGKFKVDMLNRETNANNLALQMQLQMYNDQAKAAKLNSLKEGLGQLADIASNQQGIDMQEAYLQAVSPDYAANFKYSSIFDQLKELSKKRKSNKSKKG